MRRLIAAALILLLLLDGCTRGAGAGEAAPNEIRAVWISYIDLSMEKEKDRSESAFRKKAKNMLHRLADNGYNTVFLHVRPFGDALYRSDLFSFSRILTGMTGEDPLYDPLSVFCSLAALRGIAVHGWINPFRVCAEKELLARPEWDRMRRLYISKPSAFCEVNGTLYLDPAAQQTRRLLLDCVRELMKNYPLDGIHIDDYFYPTTNIKIDNAEYTAYRDAGGESTLSDWRRCVINTFVSQMYCTVKSFGNNKIFSISPALRIDKNKETLYADVARWGACSGYCDWLIPQLYVGFRHEKYPFDDLLLQWRSLVKSDSVRLLAGLAAYKTGQTDPYAGSGREEWIRDTDILSRQIARVRETDGYSGFVLFSFYNIFN